MAAPTLDGYHGKYLDIDLTQGSTQDRPLDPHHLRDYLGGRGLATRIFCNATSPECDPLSADNVLVLATSPLLGTSAPTSCRGHMVFKSPLTGMIGSSNCGGQWAQAFKSTGYDALIIRGAAATPVMIDIGPGGAQLRSADAVWGCDVHETTDRLLAEPGGDQDARVLCIGPAGENLVRFAAVMNEKNRAYGRGGGGAVLGSKKLKALRVSGGVKSGIAEPGRFASGRDQARYLLKAVPTAKRLLRDMGTAGLIRLINVIDMLPHLNFQDNLHPEKSLESVSGESIRDTILIRSGACGRCPMACQRHTRVGSRSGEGPEFETVALLGPNCGIYDLPAITLGNYRCNELGLDTMSCGGTIACAMELAERGILSPADAHPLPLAFGNHAILPELVEKIAYREGVGDILAEGSLRLARRLGHPEASMTVKGLEIPAYDPRASYTQAIGYMTSPTGACHLRGGYAASLAFFGGAKEIPRFSLLQSPIAIRNMQNLGIIQDSLGICRFTGFAFATEPWSRMVSGVTGQAFSTAALERIADRIASLERLFNVAAGLTAEDDTLPVRFSEQPIAVGGRQRVVTPETMAQLRNDYYVLRQWDEHGIPSAELRQRLGIGSGPSS